MTAIYLVLLLFGVGCAQLDETFEDGRAVFEGTTCAKCDAATEGGEWARCWIEAGDLNCQLGSDGILVPSSMTVYVYDSAGDLVGDEALHQAGTRLLLPVAAEAYPIALEVGFLLPAETAVEGLSRQLFYVSGVFESAETEPLVFTQPFDLWYMTVGGTGFNIFHFQAEAADIDISPFTSRTSGGDSPTVRLRRSFTATGDDVQSFYWPVGDDETVNGDATITTPDGGLVQGLSVSFDEPGNYILDRAGAELLSEAEFAAAMVESTSEVEEPGDDVVADDVTVSEDSIESEDDVSDVDDCDNVCRDNEVCAGGACRNRSYQTSDTTCDDDNADCADNYVCAGGSCQSRSYQTSDAVCDDDNSDCADNYVCAARTCQHRSYQTSGAVCDDDHADCADNYSCVEGLCE